MTILYHWKKDKFSKKESKGYYFIATALSR